MFILVVNIGHPSQESEIMHCAANTMLKCSAAGTRSMGIKGGVSLSIMIKSALSDGHLLGQLTALANPTFPGCRGTNASFAFKHLPKLEALIGS